ncbi:MAG: hypothetical protein WEC12_00955 [Balneolaceae bacterium]
MNEEIINDINEELENVLNEGRDLLKEAEIAERLEELRTEAELLIRKHPLKSVLIGAAAGFLIAKVLRGD